MSTALALCIAGCSVVTCLPRVLPMMFLAADRLPPLFLRWLSFVPVAVMAALLGPDVLIQQDALSLGWHNSHLLVAVPALLVAWRTQSFFGTIAFGMGGMALLRFWGMGG